MVAVRNSAKTERMVRRSGAWCLQVWFDKVGWPGFLMTRGSPAKQKEQLQASGIGPGCLPQYC